MPLGTLGRPAIARRCSCFAIRTAKHLIRRSARPIVAAPPAAADQTLDQTLVTSLQRTPGGFTACCSSSTTAQAGLSLLRPVTRVAAAWRAACSLHALAKALVVLSVLPACVLAVDSLLRLSVGTAAPAPTAVSAAWQGPLRDMFSFTVLLSVFITCEPGAAAASLVSATGAALALFAGGVCPPAAACLPAAMLAAAASAVLFAAMAASMHQKQDATFEGLGSSSWRDDVLQQLQQGLGVLGGGLLAQLLVDQAGGPAGAGLAAAAAGALAVLLLRQRLLAHGSAPARQLLADWPAWSATLLLILQPLQQLVLAGLSPQQLMASGAASSRQQLLLLLASGCQVPRALLAGELMWYTGTCSGALLAASQLLVTWAAQMVASRAPTIAAAAAAAAGASANGSSCCHLQLGCMLPAIAAVNSHQVVAGAMVMSLALSLVLLRCGWAFILDQHCQQHPQQA